MGAEEQANPFNKWKKDAGASQTKAYDRNGRELAEGDLVYLLGKSDVMWRLQKVAPVLDPKAPPGLMELHMVAVFVTGVQGGVPITDVLKTKDASEIAGMAPVTRSEAELNKGTVQ